MNSVKINLGCGWRNFGKEWTHIDLGDYDHLDYKCDISKPLPLENNIADLIYVSHVLEYFDRENVISILKEWKRILKPGGTLRIAVPDFEAMVKLYHDNKVSLCDLLGPLYGKMPMDNLIIYHKTVYDEFDLTNLLSSVGFKDIERYDWENYEDHVNNDDHSQAYLLPKGDKKNGTLISLNIQSKK